MERPRLIVGLGNPGKQYRETRHNLGITIVEHCVRRLEMAWLKDTACKAELAEGFLATKPVCFVKPLTYMNVTGETLSRVLRRIPTRYDHVLIVCDDLDTAFGSFRFREKGGPGGHNGLKSIEMCLESRDYPRLRIGINRPLEGDVADYVLDVFSIEEKRSLPNIVNIGADIVEKWVLEGPVSAAQFANNAKVPL